MTFHDMTWLERLLFLKRIKGGSGHEETTTSNTFVTDMVAPLRKLLLSFAPKQSGSGDPSPTNVRPISGWGGVSVTRCGKNLFGGEYNQTFTLDHPIPAGSKITVSGSAPESGNTRCNLYNASGTRFQNFGINAVSGNRYYRAGVEVTDEVVAVKFDYREATDFQLELGSTLSDYEPYAGQTYSVSWQTEAGTVYGGTLDMVSGVLTVDRAMIDLGTGVNRWTYYSAQSYFYAVPPHRFTNGQDGDGACDSYAFFGTKSSVSAASLPDKSFMFTNNAGNPYIYVKDTDYTTAGDFKTAVTGKKLVYTLDEPIVYQLTPQQINTLIGTNVITTDANVEEIIYLKKAE